MGVSLARQFLATPDGNTGERKNAMKKNTRKPASQPSKPNAAESDAVREMRNAIEDLERELEELDKDIAEARKGEKGEMSAIALENFTQMRRDIEEMIESNRELYKTLLESEALERRLEEGK